MPVCSTVYSPVTECEIGVMLWDQQSVSTVAALTGRDNKAALGWLRQIVNLMVWNLPFRCKSLFLFSA